MGLFDKLFGGAKKGADFTATNVLMEEDTFWKIIATTKEKANGDYGQQQQELARELRKQTPNDILMFDNRLNRFKADAYTWKLWGAIYIIQGGCGDDAFLDFREWVIAQGKDFYYRTIQDPEHLVEVEEDEILVEWEGFGYVPATVFEELTGQEMPVSMQESGDKTESDDPSGQAWEEEDLKTMFPKLYAKYPDNV